MWLQKLVSDLWSEPAGRIFLLTVSSYFIGYSIYGGYLSGFAGGFGNLPFRLSESSISDLLTLFPAAIVTVLHTIVNGWRAASRYLLLRWIGPILASLMVVMIYGCLFGPLIIRATLVPWVFQLSFISWVVGVLLPSFISLKSTWSRRSFVAIWLLFQIAGIALLSISSASVSFIPATSTSVLRLDPGVAVVLDLVMTLMILVILLLAPVAFGVEMAKVAMKEELLSKVSRLVLKQPVVGLGSITPGHLRPPEVVGNWLQRWFAKPSSSASSESTVYICDLDRPVYFIAGLQSLVAFFVPDAAESSDVSGRIVLFARDVIYSMELQNRKRDKSPVSERG